MARYHVGIPRVYRSCKSDWNVQFKSKPRIKIRCFGCPNLSLVTRHECVRTSRCYYYRRQSYCSGVYTKWHNDLCGPQLFGYAADRNFFYRLSIRSSCTQNGYQQRHQNKRSVNRFFPAGVCQWQCESWCRGFRGDTNQSRIYGRNRCSGKRYNSTFYMECCKSNLRNAFFLCQSIRRRSIQYHQ